MTAPSPLRKIVPLLVWPVGILLLVGYCTFTRRARDMPDTTVVMTSTGAVPSSDLAVALEPARVLDLRIPFIVILGILLIAWVSRVVRRESTRDHTGR